MASIKKEMGSLEEAGSSGKASVSHQSNKAEEKGSTCDVCGKVFANPTYMNKHKKLVHLEICEDHQKCPKCDMTFKSLKNFWLHIMTVHETEESAKQFQNNLCKAVGSEAGRRKAEKFNANAVIEKQEPTVECKCCVCGKQFFAKSRLIRHMNNIHMHPHALSAIKCVRCGKLFQDEGTLEEHISEVHERSILDRLAFPCNRCHITFTTVDGLWRHKTKVHDLDIKITVSAPVTCQHCSEIIYTDYNLHVAEKHSNSKQTYTCEECGKELSDAKSLKRHINIVHATERLFSCPLCRKSFKDNRGLQRHVAVHQNTALEPNIKTMLKSVFGTVCSKTLTCGICKMVVSSSVEARIHMYVKHPKEFREFMEAAQQVGIPCLSCSEHFETKEMVISHIELMHPGQQIPTCNLCGHQELKEREINFHYKEFHPEEDRYKCKICKISFNQGKLLRFHMKREHSNEASQCPYCPEKHVKVKLHVTVKHPEKAADYHELWKSAIREEVQARLKFNEFIDPDGGRGKRKRRKGRKRKHQTDDEYTSSSEDESDLDEDDDFEETEMKGRKSSRSKVRRPVATRESFELERNDSIPHVLQVKRVITKTAAEETNPFEAMETGEFSLPENDGNDATNDVKPDILPDLENNGSDNDQEEDMSTSDTTSYRLTVVTPANVRNPKLTNADINKWTSNDNEDVDKKTKTETETVPSALRRSKRKQ